MRIVLLVILGAGTLMGASALISAENSAYCLQGGERGYPGNCQFSTYQQCVASASGTNATCGTNPRMP
ncbi:MULTISPECIES: DUF3551 domain-containing protein [unclassified Nitrobacter]|uniref:DUF3551 domain-containing protein n=1 Tax=unclassified Nitrobacter TaxID=2620411 RepID=UPI0009FBEF5C|nr:MULTISPECIES: DUF3551 domain-containing protein [unclassified Nitrobacter]MCB1393173.1 DUF3551 domain-containing protein [Nitrobacter sp.]MCV0386017.1 DUF3551 domain-containing protein [Nitrobacter sp.]